MEISNQKVSKIFSTSINSRAIRETKKIGVIVNYKVVLPKKQNKYKTHPSMQIATIYNRQQVKRKKH